MKLRYIFVLFFNYDIAVGNLSIEAKVEGERNTIIASIISSNLKGNGWNTILCMGHLPDPFYNEIRRIPNAFVVTNTDTEDFKLNNLVPYYSNTIVVNCLDIKDYEDSMLKLLNSPYWHPHAHLVLYYHSANKNILAKLFFSLWYYKAINAIIIQYDDNIRHLSISVYSPYVNDNYKLDNNFGCWTAKKIGMSVSGFEEDFVCADTCQNVSLLSKYRADYLGTCIGYNTIVVPYNDSSITHLNLFEDKGKNLHGHTLRAYSTEVEPFMIIDVFDNGTYHLRSRDGTIWNTISNLMNFTIDLNSSINSMKKPFNFEVNIDQIFSLAQRKGDIYLIPIYLFDVIIVEIDYTFPYSESGACIMSHRAGFETALFDVKMLHNHYSFLMQCILCFVCIWLIFAIYKTVEKGGLTCDQIGKDLVNAFRNVLLISLHNPPKRSSFRLFLSVSIWGYFVISFVTQATIISFFTAAKRGKEVETFEDVIEKGYIIEGMASPDLILPEDEEKFRKFNSKLVPIQDMYGCVKHMSNDSRRFCVIDCSVGRYIERNRLNENGEQYLHIAKDRIHSHYLNIIMSKHSPITEQFSKYMMRFVEAGLIKKWEHYIYADLKDEAATKPLGMNDVKGLFDAYCLCTGFTCIVFVLELLSYYVKKIMYN